MIDSMCDGLDVPKEHGAGAPAPCLMPQPVDFLPLFSSFFSAADLVPDDRIKNFCPAPSERVQPCLPQSFHRFQKWLLENSFGQVTNFDSGKSFDMEPRIKSPQASQQCQVPFARKSWVKA